MKNFLESVVTLCLLAAILFPTQHALARTAHAETVTSGALHYGENAVAPLLNTSVHMQVSGLLVRTSVTQTFSNDTPYWQEGIYVFPLPDDASVDTLKMTVGERIINGVIQTTADATANYEMAKEDGRRVSLVEQQRANLFTSHIANIPPGESVEIAIEFQSAAHYDDGEFSLGFPLTITPRYIPGSRLSVTEPLRDTVSTSSNGWSDMTGITPPMVPTSQAARTSINVDINAGIPLQSITSASHQINVTETVTKDAPAQSVWKVRLAQTEVPMDRDFTLNWTPPPGQSPRAAAFRQDSSLKSVAETTGTTDDTTSTYASIMLLPPQQLFDAERTAREVIFVIDTSGSMQGDSIEQARNALIFGIERLSDQDTFNVIAFNDKAKSLFRSVRIASSENRGKAIDWVNALHADGGTEIASAMQAALRAKNTANRLRQIVFVTDGSVGNEEEIFHYIGKHLDHSRLFTVGIGSAPNTWFMRKAAEAGRGSYVSIAEVSEVRNKMLQLFNKLEKPVLTDIQVDVIGAPTPERYPSTIPDLYAGEPIETDMYWHDGIDDAEIVISGEHAGRAWSRKLSLPAATTSKINQLAKRFASKKIEALEDSRLFSNTPSDIEEEITALALKYELVTPYTSLIAIDNTRVRDPDTDTLLTAEIPSAMPFGNTMHFPQGSIGLALRWLLALLFSLLSVVFALATLQQVRNHEL